VITTFEKLIERYRLVATLRTETALRVGTSKSLDVVGTDLPLVRDGMGRPYIPGSTFKGVARSTLEALLRGLGREQLWACDPFDPVTSCAAVIDKKIVAWKKSAQKGAEMKPEEFIGGLCTACGLFGSPQMGGRLFIQDLPLADRSAPEPMLRDGVGINRDLDVAQSKVKYDYEVVPAGVAFLLRLTLENPDEVQLALTLKLIEMFDRGDILLGGFTSRGLGRVSVMGTPVLERTTPKLLIAGSDYETIDYNEAQREASAALARALE
jgi:CRISPR-associated RAMP protein (TIGR02581 family)